jgi:Na+-transporting NADH:ubiquinone oxidoreductase subunit B
VNAPQFLKQKNMLRVLYSLAPVLLAAVYFFGWRCVAVCAVTAIACFLTEWVMVSRRKGKVTYACFVTAGLLGLSMPPTVPYWIAFVAGVIAILFAKEAFGGFGKNVFNPAIVGRAFVYVSFPIELTAWFVPAFDRFAGGFAQWSFRAQTDTPGWLARAGLSVTDAVTAATPMWARRDFGHLTSTWDLITGAIGGVFEYRGETMALAAGSMGEVSAIVIALAAVYLLVTKTANWRLTVSTLAGALGASVLFRHFLGIEAVPEPGFALCSGALLYGAVFMVTDPVSAPKKVFSQWMYGVFIGVMVVFFRYRAIFAGGVAFAILLGNMLAPSLDLWYTRLTQPKPKEKAAA